MRSTFIVLSVLLTCTSFVGCVNGPTPTPPPPVAASVSQFYNPLSTALRYNYIHLDNRGAAFGDSNYTFTYHGVYDSTTYDGLGPVDSYYFGNASSPENLWLGAYVSDSLIVEYGADCKSVDHRLVILRAPLKVDTTWVAASAFLTPDGRRVSIMAKVQEHLETIGVGGVNYPDAYLVSYDVTGPDAADPNADYQNGSRHQIYFAKNTGKIWELAYPPVGKPIWTNEIRSITPR